MTLKPNYQLILIKIRNMKKLSILTAILSIAILSGCVKELKPSDSPGNNNVTSAKPAPPPPPASILQWQKTYGSPLNELGFAITRAADGNGYVFTASALGNGGDITGYHGGTGADAWVVRTDESGAILWQKSFGGTKSEYADDIITTADGGYVFAASTQSGDGDVPGNHGGWDVWIVKLDASGTLVWSKTFGGSADDLNDLHRNCIVQTDDGGFLFAGYTGSNDGDVAGTNHGGNDAWVLRLDINGNLVWQKTYGGTLSENGNSVVKTADGNYMICGNAGSINGDLAGQPNHGGADAWLFKINDAGDPLWQKTLGGSQNDIWRGILQAPDGGYVLSGASASNDGDISGNQRYADTWVTKINTSGSIAWQKFFGGADVDQAGVRNVDASGNILLTGYTQSKNGDITGAKGSSDLWVLQLDPNGSKLNSLVFGGKSEDNSEDAVVNPDGSFTSIGRTSSTNGDVTSNHGLLDAWIVKFKF